jgi:hypothetical protein
MARRIRVSDAAKDRAIVTVVIAGGLRDPADIAAKLGWSKARVETALHYPGPGSSPWRPGQQPLSFAVQRAKQGQ